MCSNVAADVIEVVQGWHGFRSWPWYRTNVGVRKPALRVRPLCIQRLLARDLSSKLRVHLSQLGDLYLKVLHLSIQCKQLFVKEGLAMART
jgi:hypothetical protein